MNMRLSDLGPAYAVDALMDRETLDQRSVEVLRLVQSVADEALRRELDNAVGAYVVEMFDQVFAAGWKAGQKPELLIFGE